MSALTKLQFEALGIEKILLNSSNFMRASLTKATSASLFALYSKPTISAPGIINSRSIEFPSTAIFNSPTPCSCLSTCLVSSATETVTSADKSNE